MNTSSGYLLEETLYPLMNGKKMDFIPFIPLTGFGITWDLRKPVINDLANVNIKHYRNSANLENGLQLTGNPTACLAGIILDDGAGKTIKLGSSVVHQFKENGKWGFLEFSGAGLGMIREEMKSKEERMVLLGGKILTNDKKVGESAEAMRINRSGENGVLSDIALSVEEGINKALSIMAQWEGITDNQEIKLNMDFNASGLSANELNALVGAWQKGNLSGKELFEIEKKAELISERKTWEDHVAEIEQEGPALGAI